MVTSEVLEAVAQMDREDLNQLAEMIQIRRRHISEQKKVNFKVGDTVRFDVGPRRGGVLTGTLKKKNPKKAKVLVESDWRTVEWTVPYSSLSLV